MSEQLIVKPESALALIDFEQDAVLRSTVTADDLAIPYLRLFQDNSHEVKKKDPKHIEGAEGGMLFNTSTQEMFPGDPGIHVIPVTTSIRKVDEWVPLNQGGGFRGSYFPDDPRVKAGTEILREMPDGRKKRVLVSQDGNDLVETAYFFLVFPESMSWACCTMTSTKWKIARRWNTLIDGIRLPRASGGVYQPPAYSHSYILGSATEPDKSNNIYWNYTITSVGKVTDRAAYEYARDFANTFVAKVQSGEVKVTPPAENPVDSAAAASEEIPF